MYYARCKQLLTTVCLAFEASFYGMASRWVHLRRRSTVADREKELCSEGKASPQHTVCSAAICRAVGADLASFQQATEALLDAEQVCGMLQKASRAETSGRIGPRHAF